MLRKRSISLLSLLALTLCALSAQAVELKFNTQDFPPFSYETNGVVSGPVADVIAEACKSMNAQCTSTLYPWTRAQELLKTGKANAMYPIGRSAEREQWLHFSPALFRTEYGFFVTDDNPLQFKDVADVKGYSVAVFGPSNTSKTLEGIKQKLGGSLEIDMQPIDDDGFRKLSVGRVKAVFSNRDVGNATIKNMGLKNIRYAGAYQALDYYIGFSKEFTDKQVVDQFNEAVRTLFKQGAIGKIADKYHLEAAKPE